MHSQKVVIYFYGALEKRSFDTQINYAIAKYDATKIAILYSPLVGDRGKLVNNQDNFAVGGDAYSTPFHEMWHCKQAQEFEEKHGKITKENYHDYIVNLRRECKNRLDNAGINEKMLVILASTQRIHTEMACMVRSRLNMLQKSC